LLVQQIERGLGLLERRNHVDTGDLLARLGVQLPRQRQALGAVREDLAAAGERLDSACA
jgi:hypothetical protein